MSSTIVIKPGTKIYRASKSIACHRQHLLLWLLPSCQTRLPSDTLTRFIILNLISFGISSTWIHRFDNLVATGNLISFLMRYSSIRSCTSDEASRMRMLRKILVLHILWCYCKEYIDFFAYVTICHFCDDKLHTMVTCTTHVMILDRTSFNEAVNSDFRWRKHVISMRPQLSSATMIWDTTSP